jgi:2-polyprenyl-3-methyl-5-hydroxy-6-metoxy-1,4-benzoquinol methylase
MTEPLDVAELLPLAANFRETVETAKQAVGAAFEWYPYDTLGNFWHFDALLSDGRRDLLALAEGGPVLDIGCADGDLAFFIESLGIPVVAIDHPRSSHNGMAGVHAAKRALHSKVEIRTVDLDGQFELGAEQYGLVFLLGALYHLKNPFYVLETLSRHAKHCLLSTHITTELPPDRALAWLVDETELNADNTNFWVFNEAGLRRLLRRTNWRILDYALRGDASDTRAFCLLRSCYALADLTLGSGWHEPENEGWRWTERRFSATAPDYGRGRLRMRVFLHERLCPLTVAISANGKALAPVELHEHGEHIITRTVPQSEGRVDLCFELDRALPPEGGEARELGLIVASMEID